MCIPLSLLVHEAGWSCELPIPNSRHDQRSIETHIPELVAASGHLYARQRGVIPSGSVKRCW